MNRTGFAGGSALSRVSWRRETGLRCHNRAGGRHAELTLGHGIAAGREAVTRLMHRAGLQGLSGRPRYRKVPNVATAGDRVQRQFRRDGRDQLWVTDITEHRTREEEVYCTAVLDTFSRRVVGWSIDTQPTAALVTNALAMAIEQRQPEKETTVIHSDQGTQFTSWTFTQRVVDAGLLLYRVQQALGHSDSRSTERYTKLTDESAAEVFHLSSRTSRQP
jgi:transposase InsO family protein